MSNFQPISVTPAPLLAGKAAYSVPKTGHVIDLHLDANEGLVPPPELAEFLRDAMPDAVRRYPNAAPLQEALAARFGVEASRVLVTAGADDAIDRACRAVLAPGRELILPLPTFEMIPKYAALVGAAVRPLAWMRGTLPREAVLASIAPTTAMIAIVTPNNPTGVPATLDDVITVARAARHALVLVDMAYCEFADGEVSNDSFARRILEEPNVLMTRTFSKAWGLAGLRVGYAIGHAEAIQWLRAAAGPYTCASSSLAIAARWFAEGRTVVDAFIERVKQERAALGALLARAPGVEVWPSQGNFVFAQFPDARRVQDELARKGIAVRGYPGRVLMDNVSLDPCLRITCPGNERDFSRLAIAIQEVLSIAQPR